MVQRENKITEKELQELQDMLYRLEKILDPDAAQAVVHQAAQGTAAVPAVVSRAAEGFSRGYSGFLPHTGAAADAEQSRTASVPELPEIVTVLEEIRDKLKEQSGNILYYN